MRFFDRKEEIAELRKNRELSTENSRFTVLTGRRRVGKTELLHEAFYEIKRDKRRINIALLNEKTRAFLEKNPSLRGHVQKSCGLSIDDM